MLFKLWSKTSFLSFLIFVLLCCSQAHAKQESQSFTLPPVDGSPFTLKIPFLISKPGVITVSVTLDFVGRLNAKTVLVGLYQKNSRYVLVSKYFDSHTHDLRLQYKASSEAFAAGLEYYLELTNYSNDKEIPGNVKIIFPVAGEKVQKPGEGPLPNLIITDIRLDDRCKTLVFLKNNGGGALPISFWKRSMPKLEISKDNQLWGEVDIRFFDYNQALSPAGGEAVYNTGLKVFGSAKIKAMVHTEARVFEEDKTDNSKEVVLTCE